MRFLVVACDGAAGCLCSDSRLFHLSRGVLVALSVRFQTFVHNYGFCRIVGRPTFDCGSAYVPFQSSAEVDRMPCKTIDHWYYFNFE